MTLCRIILFGASKELLQIVGRMVFVSIIETGGYSLIYDGVIRRNR